jgi:hypothetical protein
MAYYGVTEKSSSNLVKWLLGVTQGGGRSECLWALTSSRLLVFDQMEQTPGAVFFSPHLECSICGIGEASLIIQHFGSSVWENLICNGDTAADGNIIWPTIRTTFFNLLMEHSTSSSVFVMVLHDN